MENDYSAKVLIERRNSNVTQMDLAKYLNLNVGTIIDIESGRITIGFETYEQLNLAINDIAAKSASELIA